MARVAALIPDLLFGSKVQAALEAAGHEVDLITGERRGVGRGRRDRPARHRPHLARRRRRRAVRDAWPPAASSTPCVRLGFFAHVEPEVRERALAGGLRPGGAALAHGARGRAAGRGAAGRAAMVERPRAREYLGRAPFAAPAAACPRSAPPSTSSTSSPSSGRASTLRSAPPPRACSRCPRTCSSPGRGTRTRRSATSTPSSASCSSTGWSPATCSSPGAPRPSCWARATSCARGTTTSPSTRCPFSASWHVHTPARVAILDTRVAIAAGRWPSIATALHARHVRRVRSLAFQRAIAQLPRVDDRMLVLLWALAERWGRVAPRACACPSGCRTARWPRWSAPGARR